MLELTVALLPADVPRVDDIAIDGRVLAFAVGVSVLTGLLFGILPALRSSAQSGDASLLRIAGALLITSLWKLMAVDPGFRAEQLLTATVAPPQFRYSRPELRRQFAEDLLARLRSVPGVRLAAGGSALPFAGRAFGSVFAIERRPDPATESGEWPGADVRAAITTDYLQALGAPILEGRAFTDADRADMPPVALVSRSLARTYWGSTSPVGARIRFPSRDPIWVTVVGVVGDIKWNNLGQERSSFTGLTSAGWLGTLYVPLPNPTRASFESCYGRTLTLSRSRPTSAAL